ncbi:uncharacterized protein LOC135260599 isoform X7 [Anguilla rostrata]|uniref:uncharacterized protein LOC135260599 isoform X7 n=1 Tax=Anguilla rostrata TaxID=7938 RepID=UPI0030CF601D
MEQCQVPADVKGTKSKQSTKILKKMKKNLRPNRSTAQSDRDVTQSETNEDHGEETNMQKDSLTADRELSASNDSLSDISNVEGSEILKKMKKNLRPLRSTAQVGREVNQSEGAEDYGEKTETRQDSLSTHRELSASNDSLSDNTKRPGILKEMKKKLRPIRSTAQSDREASQSESTEDHGEETNTQKVCMREDSLTAYSELSASKDSLSDISNLEGPGILMKMKNNLRPVRSTAQGGREVNQTEGTEDFREKTETRQISSDTDSVDPPQTHSSTETELEAPDNTQKKGGKLAGIFRKSPKLAERSLPSQENESTPTELSASNDSLPEVSTKEKGDKLTDWFRRAPKPAERTRPAQENESTRSELSADSESVLDVNTKEKGGMFSGMFRTKSPKPAESTPSAQEDESIQSELSASNDSLSDINTKEKGGIFSGMFRSKSPKRSRDPTLAQDNLSAHSELSGSKDSLSDDIQISFDANDVGPPQTHSTTETELEGPDDTQKKGGKLAGLFRKSPKPAESALLAQEDESIESELSASNTNLLDINTKEKGGIFSGMFRSKFPKGSKDPTPAQVSMDTESGTLAGGDEKREESRRPKRKVSFRVTRTLPRTPKITLLPPIQDSEEEELLEKSFEMVELPSVQESSVEVQMVELAPLPSETNPLDTTEDDDGLLDWWRTVEGWNEWNESSNFKEDEEELAIEQAADRVYLGAQLFVRLFNQRGASLQKRILELLELADAADSFHKRALKASMGGRVASVVGSVTTITGLILAPFTFGSSIIVTAVGIGVATAGTITSASAHITDSVHFTLDRKKVEKMIEGYQEEVKDIRECMEFVQQGMHTLQGWNFEKYTDSVAKRALNRNIKHVVKEGARAGKALMINTDRLVSTVQVLSVAGGAAKAAQAISVTTGVMSALFLALDIFFLAKDSHDLRKGAKTKFAKKLREVCKELQDGLLELNKVKTALQKTMDGIEVEEVEEEEEEEEDEEDLALKSDPAKMAQLEEEINQIEQKLDQEVLEKKKEGEGEGRKESRRNDSKQDHVKPQGGKMEKGEKESAKGEKGVRVEKEGKAESEGGKFGIHEMSKGGHQEDGNEDRKKEKREGDIKGEKKREGDIKGEKKREGDIKAEKKREGDEQWKSGKKEGDEQGKKERREQDEWRKKAKIESDEQRKKEPKEGGEQWKYAKKDSVPPPARPRSKAISHSTKETRWEGPDADPKAPPPARPKRCVSQREPLSI